MMKGSVISPTSPGRQISSGGSGSGCRCCCSCMVMMMMVSRISTETASTSFRNKIYNEIYSYSQIEISSSRKLCLQLVKLSYTIHFLNVSRLNTSHYTSFLNTKNHHRNSSLWIFYF